MIDWLNSEWGRGLTIAVISMILGFIGRALASIYSNSRKNKRFKKYAGDYALFFRVSTEHECFSEMSMSVRYRFGRLRAKGLSDEFSYKGFLQVIGRNIYLDLLGTTHDEKISMVFHDPLHGGIRCLMGVGSWISVIERPYASFVLITTDDCRPKKNELDNYFTNVDQIISDDYSLAVKKTNQTYLDNASCSFTEQESTDPAPKPNPEGKQNLKPEPQVSPH